MSDDALSRRIGRALARSPILRCEIQGAAKKSQALAAVEAGSADVVILDVDGGRTALSRLRELRAAHPTLPVLVVIPPTMQSTGLAALKQGAADVLRTDRMDPFSVSRALTIALQRGHLSDAIRIPG